MMNLKALAVIGLCAFATSTLLAHEEGACCAKGAANAKKEMCEASFANLNLNAEQKAQMEKLSAECMKAGCTEASMAKMEKGAQKVLTKEQLASWKSCCQSKTEHKQS